MAVTTSRKASWLPLLSEMMQLDGRDEHRDMHSTYVLWVLDDGSNVVFLNKDILNNIVYKEKRFIEWMMIKPAEECCCMISRTLLASLRYKPDYIVLVSEDVPATPFASGYQMSQILKQVEGCPVLNNIQATAEGDCNTFPVNNLLGRRLTELCCRLADRGFFSDQNNRVKYGRTIPDYSTLTTS